MMNLNENVRNGMGMQDTLDGQEVLPEHIRRATILTDSSKADKTWEQYGHVTEPIMFRNRFGKWDNRSGLKLWYYNGIAKKPLKNGYPIFPHEEVFGHLETVIKKNAHGLNMEMKEQYDLHGGDTHYWTLLGSEKFSIDGDDKVRIGVVIRNGIGTNVSLGVDLYTFREWCSNGAVAKDKQLGTFAISHVGKPERMQRIFDDAIEECFGKVKGLLQYYRKSTRIQITEKLANQIYLKTQLADIYLPDWWVIKDKKEIQKLRKDGKIDEAEGFVNVEKKASLWETFNYVTEQHRDRLREKKVGFSSVSGMQTALHKSMIQIVKQQGGRV
jgi:hypothetical protein